MTTPRGPPPLGAEPIESSVARDTSHPDPPPRAGGGSGSGYETKIRLLYSNALTP